jgi:hypothetical protein
MSGFPFVKSRPKPKREGDPRRVRDRVRLYGDEKTDLRRQVYERSRQRCERLEATGKPHHEDCPINGIDWDSGHLAHLAHGARKTDTPEGTYWASSVCHSIEDHNPKCVPKRPGRVMRMAEAIRYWQGQVCFCDGVKLRESSFCGDCKEKLSPQQRLDLDELKNAEWLQTVALCEMTILERRVRANG